MNYLKTMGYFNRGHEQTIEYLANLESVMAVIGAAEELDDAPIMYHDIVSWGTQAMKENCNKAMVVFAMKEM
ncbi:MAG: hypothetical protein IJ335_12685 [Lachnospiraceae bacterium]|nr:hypothetical protein [Lachnospiraceae bacterium]